MKTMPHELKKSGLTCSRLEVLCCLIARQDEPVRLEEIAESTGLPLEQVEYELDELEGPIANHVDSAAGAYIHRARCSSQVVFIT